METTEAFNRVQLGVRCVTDLAIPPIFGPFKLWRDTCCSHACY